MILFLSTSHAFAQAWQEDLRYKGVFTRQDYCEVVLESLDLGSISLGPGRPYFLS